MAHFAEIDSNNIVLRVVVACNQDIANNGGELSEQAAEHFKKTCPLSENGVKWVQTSYNINFRKKYASKNDVFDFAKDKFISPQPYPSWSLDANDDWQAPITYPTITTYGGPNEQGIYNKYLISWDENTQKWLGKDQENNQFVWIPSSLSWVSTGN
jgi:hypothetical protein